MKYHNPWKVLDSKKIYSNPWISVREDQVIRPDGKPGIYGVVSTRIATGVVAITPQHEIYLVGQYRYPIEQYSWEIIEGGSDPGEDPQDAVKRELKEEAGLVAKSWRELGGEIHLSNCFSAEVAKLYLAWDLSETAKAPDGTEILEVKKLPFKEAFEMVLKGEITDAMSVIGIFRAERLLREEGQL